MNYLTGPRTAYAHGEPTDRVLEAGDFMHIQFGAHYRRYCCTIGRQLCLGKPTPRMREVYQVARDAGDACIEARPPAGASPEASCAPAGTVSPKIKTCALTKRCMIALACAFTGAARPRNLILADISQIIPKFGEIVPPFHRPLG